VVSNLVNRQWLSHGLIDFAKVWYNTEFDHATADVYTSSRSKGQKVKV